MLNIFIPIFNLVLYKIMQYYLILNIETNILKINYTLFTIRNAVGGLA